MTIWLYDKPECPFCWRVRLALIAQRRPFISLDRRNPQVNADWQRLSTQQTVPVLVDGALVLTDSGIILEYLQDSGGGLLPTHARERARIREIVRYADAVLGKASREFIFEKRDKLERDWDLGRIATGAKGYIDALPWLEQRLGGRSYFSESYSVAECALLPRIALAAVYGVPTPGRFPNLTGWFDRMVERQGFADSAPSRVREWLASRQI